VRWPSWIWFVAVGCAAAAVHFAVVLLLVGGGFVRAPLVANILAWCVAFGVSYLGHRALTFRRQQAPLARSALRFAVVSLGGLALNEAAYAVLLHFTPLRYDVALVLVLLGVAVITYWLGRHWAFAGSSPVA
jgi:putative flippase GtrA